MSQLLLIDADGIVYRAGFATEKTRYLVRTPTHTEEYDSRKAIPDTIPSENIWSRKDTKDEEEALMLTSIIVRDIKDRYAQLEPVLWLSPSAGNFRDQIATRARYKGNRDAAVRPTHHKAIRAYLEERYGARTAVGQEADDALGIGMTNHPGSVLVSFDKDMLQIPGTHYNWVTKEETKVSARQGQMAFFRQVLSGDATDNIPGIPGIGPKTAEKLLDGVKTVAETWQRIVKAYEDNGLDYDAALETARLVYVRRKEGEIWNPPS